MLKLKNLIRRFASQYWVCPRCGTTNKIFDLYCKYCKNRRPD